MSFTGVYLAFFLPRPPLPPCVFGFLLLLLLLVPLASGYTHSPTHQPGPLLLYLLRSNLEYLVSVLRRKMRRC